MENSVPPGDVRPQSTPSTPGVWPPPPQTAGDVPMVEENTSGLHQGVPSSVAALRWNWGAFALTWLWCLNHKMVAAGLGVLALGIVSNLLTKVNSIFGLVGFVQFGVSIYFGLKGNQWAWENRRFPSGYSEFLAVQAAWMKWGIVLFALSLIIIFAAVLLPILAHLRGGQ